MKNHRNQVEEGGKSHRKKIKKMIVVLAPLTHCSGREKAVSVSLPAPTQTQSKKQTNERTNEQTNKRTKKQRNKETDNQHTDKGVQAHKHVNIRQSTSNNQSTKSKKSAIKLEYTSAIFGKDMLSLTPAKTTTRVHRNYRAHNSACRATRTIVA